jgi:hypothetical protein
MDAATCRSIVVGGVRSYQDAIRLYAGIDNLAVWYERLDLDAITKRWGSDVGKQVVKQTQQNVAKAESKDQMKARAKLTKVVDGELRFISDPPLLVPARELLGDVAGHEVEDLIHDTIRHYRRTLQGDRRRLLESYRFTDLARKVVGVGSVGTRAWVALFIGRDEDDTLILQVKEAEASVLERFLGKKPTYTNHGQRVVEGQRLMQAASDIFLGWQRVNVGTDGRPHDYYLRQLWDWKFSVDIDSMKPPGLAVYARVCGWTLALGHARSGDSVAISSYLGAGDVFAQAIADFARSYADQNEADHQALIDAIATGRIKAQVGV